MEFRLYTNGDNLRKMIDRKHFEAAVQRENDYQTEFTIDARYIEEVIDHTDGIHVLVRPDFVIQDTFDTGFINGKVKS